jgi:hypothetical protein
VDPTDQEAVLKLKDRKPQTVGNIRKVMGFIEYYRTYIANFSRRVKPIYDLLKDEKELSPSSKKQQKSIDYLRFYVPIKEFVTYMETSPLPVKGCKI